MRFVDVGFKVLLAPGGFFAQVGCTLWLRDSLAKGLTANRFDLVRTQPGALLLSGDRYVADQHLPIESAPLGMTVASQPAWYSVDLHVEIDADITGTMRVRDLAELSTPSDGVAVVARVARAGAVDTLMIDCGVTYAALSSGAITVTVDDLKVDACTR